MQLAFDGTPWREVLKWLADESNLALHLGDVPPGSFTYTDPQSFTPQDAITRVNLFLLPEGFTIVKSGRLLSVINLGDARSIEQLETLAKLVTVDQLDQLGDHDVVKCIFPLEELEAEEAVEELSAFKFMTNPAIFSKTNQLMITDTAAKLKSVKAILSAFEPSTLDDGTIVKNFALKHIHAEDFLTVARPHLGLATGEMIGIDVSLSADVHGKNIFATGIEDKVDLIEGLINALDVEPDDATAGDAVLRSHLVPGGNVETIYNVLLTMLADEAVRMSVDEATSTIVALAPPDIHKEIEQTVAQLEASDADFEIIQLKTVDPYLVISLLEEMLDLPGEFDDPETIDPDAPKIDADPGNMRLFVRGKRHKIDQIKKIVDELDTSQTVGGDNDIRIFPLKGQHAERVLETAAKFWRAANPIILHPSAGDDEEHSERVVTGDMADATSTPVAKTDPRQRSARFLTDNINSQAPVIQCHLTPRGLLMQSEDTEALNRLEEHLRVIAGPADSLPSPPVVFYLKYTRPDDAIRMLAELLDGGEAAAEFEAGSLIRGYVSGAGLFLGSLVTSRSGTTTMTAGTTTVVADPRLNRLIAQGTASDIELIEGYLKIIDKDSSITDVETYGTSHVIELVHTRASVVAATIRDAYAGRVSAATGASRQNQGRTPQQQQQGQRNATPQATPANNSTAANNTTPANNNASSGNQPTRDQRTPERRSSSSQPSQNLEPKLTIAIHEPSNSLIVTAPDQLFKEVEQLVKLIDQRSEQSVEVVRSLNAAGIHARLQRVLSGSAVGTGSSRSSATPPTRSASPTRPSSPTRSPSPAPRPTSPSPIRGRPIGGGFNR